MKVLFLDVDGVLNNKDTVDNIQEKGGYFPIDAYMAFLVGRIVLNTACQVVLSSSWRHSEDAVAQIEKRVTKLLGKTPELQGKSRGLEIQAWLDEHPDVTAYAIIDDDSDAGEGHGKHFFQTSWEEGLTTQICEDVSAFLNRKVK